MANAVVERTVRSACLQIWMARLAIDLIIQQLNCNSDIRESENVLHSFSSHILLRDCEHGNVLWVLHHLRTLTILAFHLFHHGYFSKTCRQCSTP